MSRLRIFDFDGTLVDSYMPVAELDARILSKYITPISTLEMATEYGGATLEDKILMACTKGHTKLNKSDLDNLLNERHAEHREIYANGTVRAFRGIEQLLKTLDAKCVASQNAHDRLGVALKNTRLLHHFDNKFFFGADQVDLPKPAPDLFLFAAKEMGYHPEDCDVIGDSTDDIKGAVSAGITAYGFADKAHPEHDRLVEKLYDAGADKVFTSVSDLNLHLNKISTRRLTSSCV